MADVFISYAREDADTARRFADGFQAAGFSVWWDDALRSGEAFDESIERALREAGCETVDRFGLCTSCEDELFFSHRRDRGRTGRQGIVATLR